MLFVCEGVLGPDEKGQYCVGDICKVIFSTEMSALDSDFAEAFPEGLTVSIVSY